MHEGALDRSPPHARTPSLLPLIPARVRRCGRVGFPSASLCRSSRELAGVNRRLPLVSQHPAMPPKPPPPRMPPVARSQSGAAGGSASSAAGAAAPGSARAAPPPRAVPPPHRAAPPPPRAAPPPPARALPPPPQQPRADPPPPPRAEPRPWPRQMAVGRGGPGQGPLGRGVGASPGDDQNPPRG